MKFGRRFDIVEVQLYVDVVVVIDRLVNACLSDAGPGARFGEAVERTQPGRQVSDRVLDVIDGAIARDSEILPEACE